MGVIICECCGAVVLSKEESIFKPDSVKDKLLRTIRDSAGISGPELKRLVFSVSASDNLLSVHICKMNLELRRHGLRIVGKPHNGYKLVQVETEPCTPAA